MSSSKRHFGSFTSSSSSSSSSFRRERIPLPPPEVDRLSSKQRQCFDQAMNGHNVFITGCGGTGKSFLIEQIYRGLCKLHGRVEQIALTATTGIAAVNIGGVTLHHWAGIRLGDSLEDFGFAWGKKNDWRATKVLLLPLFSFSLSFFSLLPRLSLLLLFLHVPPSSFSSFFFLPLQVFSNLLFISFLFT
jgi:hypothetical protein